MTTPIYLDNQSTTPLDPAVLEEMLPYFTEDYGNPHATEHIFGWRASSALENARQNVADLIGAERSNIIFTSGATESVALAILGLSQPPERRSRNKIVTVATEHSCVLETCKHMSREGYAVTVLPVRPDGIIDLELLRECLDDKTLLVSVMLANNEIGVLQPLAEITQMCRQVGSLVHTDATQAVGKMPVDVETLDIDMLSASAHKLYGPKGIGLLYFKDEVKKQLQPLTYGGGQEKGMRPGTVALPLAVGLGEAARIADETMGSESKRIRRLRDMLLDQLLEVNPDIRVLGNFDKRLPGNLSLVFPDTTGNSIVAKLGDRLAVSTGSSCSSTSSEASHVIKALGIGNEMARAALRVSVGRFNTEEEMSQAADLLLSVTTKESCLES